MKANHEGKAVLVTGAAGGLGRTTALSLGRAGAETVLVDMDEAGLLETQNLLCGIGAKAHVQVTDLSESAGCDDAVAAAIAACGRLDALCNVAGVIYFTHTTEMPDALWNRTLAVNLSAPFFLSRSAIPHLIAAKGAIVNVASAAAFVGEAYLAAYAATKAALVHLTRSMAMEFMHKPLRINAVAPGGMATPMSANIKIPDGADMSLVQRFTGIRQGVETRDVADLICFLASDAARGYHGSVVTIDNGITAG